MSHINHWRRRSKAIRLAYELLTQTQRRTPMEAYNGMLFDGFTVAEIERWIRDQTNPGPIRISAMRSLTNGAADHARRHRTYLPPSNVINASEPYALQRALVEAAMDVDNPSTCGRVNAP